ncbi:hypothetical protein BJ165DRAFT_1502875 [Panaeolus papilionaceus]|nr:hypothetical protein BJ165DRAFT_1502875 [Panaeolus papilionaceus]
MALEEFLKLSKMLPDHAGSTLVVKLYHFLRFMPQFNKDILLAQPASWVPSQPPQFLPKSILILMSNFLDEITNTVQSLSDYLKGSIWHLEDNIKTMDG